MKNKFLAIIITILTLGSTADVYAQKAISDGADHSGKTAKQKAMERHNIRWGSVNCMTKSCEKRKAASLRKARSK